MLLCPVCKSELTKENQQYICDNKHCFDIAKQGYTNLYLKSSKNSGDNKDMVEARQNFLNQDFYNPLVMELVNILKQINPKVIVDAGCGEGYYTNIIQDNFDSKIYAFDLSKEALKYAAKKNHIISYFLSSVFDIPLSDESCDVLLNIFSPLAEIEYSRLIKKGGYLIKVDPNHNHLKQLKEILYDDVYENETFNLSINEFELESFHEVNFMMNLDQKAISDLFKMTPYYYKSAKDKAQKLMNLKCLECEASFIIYLYKRK